MVALVNLQAVGARVGLPAARVLADEGLLPIVLEHVGVEVPFRNEGLRAEVALIRALIRLGEGGLRGSGCGCAGCRSR